MSREAFDQIIEQIAQEWDGCVYDAPGGFIYIGQAIRDSWNRRCATPVPAGMVMVPKEPTEAMLRPFYGCPPDELQSAWRAAVYIASRQALKDTP